MKKILFTIIWGILSFVVAQMALAFVSGMLFYTLAASGIESESAPHFIMLGGMFVALVISGIVVLMGIRGQLPGTKTAYTIIPETAADSTSTIDEK